MKGHLTTILLTSVFAFSTLMGAEKSAGIGPNFKGPVGLQLYSLRAEFTRNVPPALEKVKGFGIRYVETAGTYGLSPAKFREMLKANGLEAVSGHFSYDRYRDDLDAVVQEAKALGLKYAGTAWITHKDVFDEQEARDASAVFNRAGQALKKEGIQFFYHVHGFEFQPHADGTLLDLMMQETNPNLVRYQMDVFWVVHPGQDPVKLLEKYKGRWELMHLKDMRKGVKTGVLTGKSDVTNDVVLGTGQMNWPAILNAAQKAGIKWYFIEDESPTAAEQIPQSLKYLETVKF
jgi:sugar phosphate isomerase/epimerase